MSFVRVTGHQRLMALLARVIASDSLPPSLLFAGPRGIGKRRVATALAQTLNCLEPVQGDVLKTDACGHCAACSRIGRGIYPDVLVVEPDDTGSIKIEQVREVADRAQYRPFEGRRRVVIVDEADAMTLQAQSALLKILEEPPSASVFVLVSSSADSLLPTVLSRCYRLRFGPLAVEEIVKMLMSDHGRTEREARALAVDADGSLGRALASDTVNVTEARSDSQKLLVEVARESNPRKRLAAMKTLLGGKSTPAHEQREHLSVRLRILSSLLRDLGVLSAGADLQILANTDLRVELEQLTGAYDHDRSTRAFGIVDGALSALERKASPKIVADWLVLRI
jgi:DNA polymerase-3 subunit delta'